MVMIPTSKGPSVQLNPLSGQRLSPYAEANPSPVPGILAKTMGALSEMQQRADALRVEDTVNKLRMAQTDLEKDYGSQVGGNVLPKDGQGFTQTYEKKFDDLAASLAGDLTDRQKKAFQQKVGLLKVPYLDGVAKHEANQIRAYGIQTDKSTIAQEADNAARNVGNQMELTLGKVRLQGAVESLAKQQGWDETTKSLAMTDALTQFHSSVIGGAIDRKDMAHARAYLDEKEGEMDPAKVAATRKLLAQTGDAIQQEKDFEEIRDSGKSLEDQLREAEKRYAKDPEGLKAVKADLVSWHGQLKASQQAEEDVNVGKVLGYFRPTTPGQKGMSVTQIKQSPEWAKIPEDRRQKLVDYWDGLAKGHDPDNDPATFLDRFATYLHYADDRKALAGMDDLQITALAPQIGPRLAQKLMLDKRDAIGQLDKLGTVNLNNLPWKDIAEEYGVKAKGKLGYPEKAKLGSLYDTFTDRIRLTQRSKGRPLDQEEQEGILRDLLVKVPEKRGWWNPYSWVGGSANDFAPGNKYMFQVNLPGDIEGTDQEKADAINRLKAVNQKRRNPLPEDQVLTPLNIQAMINATRGAKQ